MKRIEQKVKAGQTHTLTEPEAEVTEQRAATRRQGRRPHVAAGAQPRTAGRRWRRRHRGARQQAQTQRRAATYREHARRAPRLMHGRRGQASRQDAPQALRRRSATSRRPRSLRTRRRGHARGKQLTFVVQKHAARRLHWDFRLEWKGTLRSWAVPKGPSLDPGDKRLAVEVEDHPIAYAKFEGDIPKGQYGGGHVDIWDNGTWEPSVDSAKGLAKGHLEFVLFGKKLVGQLAPGAHAHAGQTTQWLLMKSNDFAAARMGADADVIDAGHADDPKRLSRRKPCQAAKRAQAPQPRSRPGTRGSALPATLKPMLATLVDKVPGDEGWVYELKYDGVRLLCRCDGDDVRCISRNGIDWTHKVGPVVDALAKLKLDGRLGGRRAHRHGSERPLGLLVAAAHPRTGPHRGAAVLHLRPALLERRGSARSAAVASARRDSTRPSPNYQPRARCAWRTRSIATAPSCWRASATSISKA